LVSPGCSPQRDQIMGNLQPKYNPPREGKYLRKMVADALIRE
jgi:hypothetical protein